MIEYCVACDVETTGIDEHTDALLEIGIAISDMQLNLLHKQSWLWPGSCGDRVQKLYEASSAFVQHMHTNNELWSDLYRAGNNCPDPIPEILTLLSQIGISANSQVEVINRNPGFDLRFLRVNAPALASCFHYHMIDICSFQCFLNKWAPGAGKYVRASGGRHRAADDAADAFEELKFYKQQLGL